MSEPKYWIKQDGTLIELEEIQTKSPLMIFYPSGENTGGILKIFFSEYEQVIIINNNGKIESKINKY